MGARTTTSTSGGGAATPVANDFQAWLSSMLNGNQYQPGQGSLLANQSNNQQAYENGIANMSPQQRQMLERINGGPISPTAPHNTGYTDSVTGGAASANGSSGMGGAGGVVNPFGTSTPTSYPGSSSSSSSSGGSPFQNAFNSMLNGQLMHPGS